MIVLVVTCFAAAIGLGHLRGPALEVPASSSARTEELIADGMPGLGSEQMILAFDSPILRVDDNPYQDAVSRCAQIVAAVPGVGGVLALPHGPERDPHHVYLLVGVRGDHAEQQRVAPRVAAAASAAVSGASRGRVTVALTGLTPVFAEMVAADLRDMRRVERSRSRLRCCCSSWVSGRSGLRCWRWLRRSSVSWSASAQWQRSAS
ncbi:hypothetical protein [Streptomyces sp. NPDC047841]|uniref:hypothetical protein n=1 Tax=Streptomyces sp. NPDC047841 TaxID=3154708 RepID=UPI00345591E6